MMSLSGTNQATLKRNASLMSVVMVLAAIACFVEHGNHKSVQSFLPSRHLESTGVTPQMADNVGPYNQESIMKTAPNFPKFVPKLLVWDGKKFQVFGLQHRNTQYFDSMKYTFRYIDTVPLLVHALKTNFPDRFKPDSPPFELLFSDADSPHSECINSRKCPTGQFSPMLFFGSVPRDQYIFPTMRAFPNPVFMHCLYEFQVNGKDSDCAWPQEVNEEADWADLQDTIVWRGADWAFLHYDNRFQVDGPQQAMQRLSAGQFKGKSKQEIVDFFLSDEMVSHFGPRWRAAFMTVRAEDDPVPWIDSRFVGGENTDIHSALARRGANITGDRMDSKEMSSKYKYQIDFGGGGGTTWEGTLTKLLMPGVLFHHETANKDWFYDIMEPWKHYIPVKSDLTDLYSAYQMAQQNPEKAKKVSNEASKLAKYILSPQYMGEVYQQLFVDYLGKLVANYDPPKTGRNWEAMATKYADGGFHLYNIASCNGKKCSINCRKGEKTEAMFINDEAPKRGGKVQQAPAGGLRGGGATDSGDSSAVVTENEYDDDDSTEAVADAIPQGASSVQDQGQQQQQRKDHVGAPQGGMQQYESLEAKELRGRGLQDGSMGPASDSRIPDQQEQKQQHHPLEQVQGYPRQNPHSKDGEQQHAFYHQQENAGYEGALPSQGSASNSSPQQPVEHGQLGIYQQVGAAGYMGAVPSLGRTSNGSIQQQPLRGIQDGLHYQPSVIHGNQQTFHEGASNLYSEEDVSLDHEQASPDYRGNVAPISDGLGVAQTSQRFAQLNQNQPRQDEFASGHGSLSQVQFDRSNGYPQQEDQVQVSAQQTGHENGNGIQAPQQGYQSLNDFPQQHMEYLGNDSKQQYEQHVPQNGGQKHGGPQYGEALASEGRGSGHVQGEFPQQLSSFGGTRIGRSLANDKVSYAGGDGGGPADWNNNQHRQTLSLPAVDPLDPSESGTPVMQIHGNKPNDWRARS